jgi:hypothetical protein
MPFSNVSSNIYDKIGIGLSVVGTLIVIINRNKN